MSFGFQCENCKAFAKTSDFNPAIPDHFIVVTTNSVSMHFCSKRCAAVYLTGT